MIACQSLFVYFPVKTCVRVQPVWDTCMHARKYLGLLHELVLSVCECGRGRPSACQYVLMLHIWFPNFPPTLPALPLAPLHRHVRTVFCFFSVEGVVGGGDM